MDAQENRGNSKRPLPGAQSTLWGSQDAQVICRLLSAPQQMFDLLTLDSEGSPVLGTAEDSLPLKAWPFLLTLCRWTAGQVLKPQMLRHIVHRWSYHCVLHTELGVFV